MLRVGIVVAPINAVVFGGQLVGQFPGFGLFAFSIGPSDYDCLYPRAQSGFLSKLRQAAKNVQKSVLQHVVGRVKVARHAVGERVHGLLITVVQLPLGSLVVFEAAIDKLVFGHVWVLEASLKQRGQSRAKWLHGRQKKAHFLFLTQSRWSQSEF